MSATRLFARAVVRRCPRCGTRGIFTGWFALRERCPGCDWRFEREEGYWVGAVAVNTIAAEVAFGVVLLVGVAMTWPDVPWWWIGGIGAGVMVMLPVWFYPVSKSLWVAVDVAVNPNSDEVPSRRG